MSDKKTFKDYNDEIEKQYANESFWEDLKSSKKVTLLLGSGVTSCLVGNWNELLNELAVLRVASEGEDMSPQDLLDYLNKCCGGKFLPEDTGTLEKGEYLQYCIADRQLFNSREEDEKWREKVFAGRVASVVQRLIKRHLCDGAGWKTEEDYKTDFLKWCRNTEIEPFSLRRKILANSEETEKALDKYQSEEIAKKLNAYYKVSVDITKLNNLFASGTEKADDIYKMFDSLFVERSGNSCLKEIESILKHKDMKDKTNDKKIKTFLKKIAAYLLWRPNYDTLETILSMCINRDFRNVITYNFDTIFDRLLIDREVQEVLTTEERVFKYIPVRVYGINNNEPLECIGCGIAEKSDVICVHHVHGIVDETIDVPEPIVFSETAYSSYQQLSLNYGSIQIAEAYLKGSLLCIGFSGTDPNFRGIIRQLNLLKKAPVFGDEDDHLIFLTRRLKDIKAYYNINEDLKEPDLSLAFRCACTYLEMLKYYYMNEVEVTILWSPEYKDMNQSLRKVYGL